METSRDLFNTYCDTFGAYRTMTWIELRDLFHALGYMNYRTEGQAFLAALWKEINDSR